MIEVEGPDGTIYEFPAGTDQATMKAAMQKVYGAPQQAQPAARAAMESPAPQQIQPDSANTPASNAQRSDVGGASTGVGASGSWDEGRRVTFSDWKSMSRAERQSVGLPVSAIGGQMAFDRFSTGISGNEREFILRDGEEPQKVIAGDNYGIGMTREADRQISSAMRKYLGPGMRGIEAFNNAFTNMYMLGGMDELQGGIDAAMTGRPYAETVQGARDELRAQREADPIASTAGGLLGAITSVPSQAAMRAFPAGGSLGKQMLAGAGAGAALGGAQGFMEGEGGIRDRANSAAVNGAFGGVLGAAAPAVFAGLGSAYRGARNALAESRGIGQVARSQGISTQAGRQISDMLGMDDPALMRQALDQAGPDAMLADAGPSAQGLLDMVIQSPGEGARTALRRIDDRAAGAGQRVNGILDQVMGDPNGLNAAQGAIRQSTAAARSAAYDAAYSQPIDYASSAGMKLEGLLSRVPGKAISDANRLMQLEGNASRQILANIADDGSVTFQRMPDVRQWDYIKRALDQAASAGEGQGALGGQTPLGRAYQGLGREIRDSVADAVPAYRTALDTAADAIGRVQGVQFGAEMMRPGVTREAVKDMIGGATEGEKAAIRQGVRQYLDDTLANVRAVASDPNVDARQAYKAMTDLSSPSARAKLETLLGKDWAPVREALDQAASAIGLRGRVAANSRTFARQEANAAFNDAFEPGALRKGEVVKSAKGLLQMMTGATPSQVNNLKAGVKNEMADLLTRPGARGLLDAIEQARSAHPILPHAGRQATGILNYLGIGSVPATAPELRARTLGR